MPSWIDEGGYNWYGKLECKRCLCRFDADESGQIPEHDCIRGRYKSENQDEVYYVPVCVRYDETIMPDYKRNAREIASNIYKTMLK
jgi:hypothetical protein